MKASFIMMCLCLNGIIAQAQQKIILNTTIDQVTVFLIGAQINRTGKVNLPEGKSIIRLTGLTPDLDPKSIQVKSNDDLTILSVAHEWNSSAEATQNKSIDSLKLLNEDLDARSGKLRMRDDVLLKKLNLLSENERIGNQNTGVTMEHLTLALELFDKNLMLINLERLRIAQQLDSLSKLKTDNIIKTNLIRGTPLLSKSEVEIAVLTSHPLEGNIQISYIVRNAGWTPRYDIRAKDITQPIQIDYKADVHQLTGEIWKNVKLTFSNGSPYARQTAPELSTWRITTVENTIFKRIGPSELTYGARIVTGIVKDKNGLPLKFANVNVAGHNLSTQTDDQGSFSILMPSDADNVEVNYKGFQSKSMNVSGEYISIDLEENRSQTDEFSVNNMNSLTKAGRMSGSPIRLKTSNAEQVIVMENQISVEFKLDGSTTILSDGKNTSLELQKYEIVSGYHYETTPKLDRGAYLVATLTNWEKYHLIEGQANLYFNNTYIGRTILDPINLSDTLEISLGRDPDVLVERIKEEEFSKRTFLGSNTIIEKTFRISVRNKKQSPIDVQITDQVPISINDNITVTATQISGGKKEESSGIIKWNLNVSPAMNRDIMLAYAVKYPSRESVMLE
ncbi:MAG TPA: mucoidy inhibitor MuiA family protein [Saprospiraceae bacterium]|nr:mucoidy inhibitor MuiA family protein [Saprospiraceae bacterium]